jgi:antitoxin component YwqK of YwqJK toxin-antitoxin module
MKYLSIFFIFCFLSLTAFPQDTINRVNPAGQKTGYWIKKDSTGRKIYEGHFRDGMPQGTFRYYYPTGNLKAVSTFSRDGKRSTTTTYFASGKKMAEGIYLDEKRDSLWRFFSEFDGDLLSEEFYKNGKKEGEHKTYYPGKGVAELVTWKNGLREGPWIQYYSDGTIKMRASNKNNNKEGMIEVFSETGGLLIRGYYKEGDPDGIWLYYDSKNKQIKKEIYDKGAMVSSEEADQKK